MQAGDLSEQIVIQARTDTQDAAGQPIPAWSTLDTVWANANPFRGREYFAASGQVAESPMLFVIPYRTDVTTRHRVTWGGAVYDIRNVEDFQGRHVWTYLHCDTGLTQG